jgi:hypothetical protein
VQFTNLAQNSDSRLFQNRLNCLIIYILLPLTRTIKVICLSHFLQFAPALKSGPTTLYRDRSIASYKTLYTLTCDLLATNLVPRHSYNPQNLVPGWQKPRHGLFITAVYQDITPIRHFCSQPPCPNQHKRHFIAGPLCLRYSQNTMTVNAQARVWQPPPRRPSPLSNTCFFACPVVSI